MIWYKDFYAGDSMKKKRKRVKWKILHNAGQLDIYEITLSSNPANLLDIIPSWELMQKYYPKKGLFVVGVDKGYENAIELAGRIIMDVFQKTGNLDVRDYFLEKHRQQTRKGPVWKSCF